MAPSWWLNSWKTEEKMSWSASDWIVLSRIKPPHEMSSGQQKLDNIRQMLKTLWAATKTTHQRKKQTYKAQKASNQWVCNESHPDQWKVQQDFGRWGMGLENRRVITNPLIISKMFSRHLHHNIITSTGLFQMNSCRRRRGHTAVRIGWSWWTWPTSAAELAPHIPTGSCNRKTWCLSD